MEDVSQQVQSNTQALNNGQRRAFNVRINGEEHSATARSGVANILFPIDGQLMGVSEFAFKLIINDGITGGSEGTTPSDDPTKNWSWGENQYPTLLSWLQRYPLGSRVNVDTYFGCQCYDYASAFWRGQVNRNLLTGGANAKGTWLLKRAENAGDDFELIERWADIQPGDWVVWGDDNLASDMTGHIALALEAPKNLDGASTVFCRMQNEKGDLTYGSPISDNTIPFEGSAYGDFLGGFRYKKWHE